MRDDPAIGAAARRHFKIVPSPAPIIGHQKKRLFNTDRIP
jgi:hypothetical protein